MFWTKNAGYAAEKSISLSNVASVEKSSVPLTGFLSNMHVKALNMQERKAQAADMLVVMLRTLMIFSRI